MINGIDNGLLTTDLNADGYSFLNVTALIPPPPNLVGTDDIRLVDDRVPLDGSVTNDSVSDFAEIEQSKLLLHGAIPPQWLGFGADQAAPGSLTEYLTYKNVANGYAGLDGTGKISLAQLPGGTGTGTVTSVSLTMPADFNVTGSPVTTSGTIVATWNNIQDQTWFGNASGGSAAPTFNTGPITVAMVPDLPADKIVSGTLAPERLPPAIGLGPDHAPGAVPDPGDIGNPDDYLARDMTYKPKPTIGASYQPVAPAPVLTPLGSTVSISSDLIGASIFYKVTGMPEFLPVPNLPFQVTLTSGQTVDAYAARAGYTNSSIVFYVLP